MATDTAALAALVIAVVALIVATGQLTQALMATAYTIRKCDGIVTGGLTKGGIRRWHWRQFRFTVKFQAIVFALPPSIYTALGISPTIRVETPSQELWMKAMKLRESRSHSTQGCSISFVQDLVMFNCIRPDDMSVIEESGDRIPDDLTVAPTRVDAISVMLTCIAMGMQVFRYSPTTGEIALGGGVGGISSSAHPVLGCLLHYSVFSNEPSIGFEATRRHGRALRQEKGVWANTVFGKFTNRSFSPELVSLERLRGRHLPILRAQGWPEDSYTDTIGGAACFMAFAHVDAYEAVPPSVVRRWCAHFAEIIVKAHHVEILKKELEGKDAFTFSPELFRTRQYFIDKHGCSSPYLPWESFDGQTDREPASEKRDLNSPVARELLRHVEKTDVLAVHYLITGLSGGWQKHSGDSGGVAFDKRDPSTYIPMNTAWEVILRADQCMRLIYLECKGDTYPRFTALVEKIVATAISSLSETGAPSWGISVQDIENFLWERFPAACNKNLSARPGVMITYERGVDFERWVPVYARLSILRAAYYTIMMRAAEEIGPGLTEDSRIDTALAYMA